MPLIRLDKFICDQGLAARKEVRQIIKAGRVRLDGAAPKPNLTRRNPWWSWMAAPWATPASATT